MRPFVTEADFASFFEFAPHGKVPALVDGETTAWESLAILEYVAERFPDAGFWPDDRATRAHARCAASEMHAGFMSLRGSCPMNMRRPVAALDVDDGVRRDVARIQTLWAECLSRHGGPFLYGETFTIADGMYAPVVNRLRIYELSDHEAVRAYTDAMMALPAWQAWETAARAEPWVVEFDEA